MAPELIWSDVTLPVPAPLPRLPVRLAELPMAADVAETFFVTL